jgi:hypothetical protein
MIRFAFLFMQTAFEAFHPGILILPIEKIFRQRCRHQQQHSTKQNDKRLPLHMLIYSTSRFYS